MKIEFYKKNVYGNELMYLKNQEGATEQAILKLINQKSITEQQMKQFAVLGVEFVQVLN